MSRVEKEKSNISQTVLQLISITFHQNDRNVSDNLTFEIDDLENLGQGQRFTIDDFWSAYISKQTSIVESW